MTDARDKGAARITNAAKTNGDDSPFLALAQSQFAALLARTARGGPAAWIDPVRRAAFDRFERRGLPTMHDEAWRCTSIAPIAKTPFVVPVEGASSAPDARTESDSRIARRGEPPRSRPELYGADENGAEATRALVEKASFGVDAGIRLVFVNGRYVKEHSSLQGLPTGVRLMSLGEALANDSALVEPHLGRLAGDEHHPFAALNTAFLEDGALLSIPAGAVVEAPIFLLFLSTPSREPTLTHPRTLVVAGTASQATLIESYAGPERGVYFTNAVTEIVAEEGAVIDHYKLQREGGDAFHVANLRARVGSGAVVASHSFSLGGALVRNDVEAVLAGEGASCTLNGLFIAADRQHVDNHTVIDHATPHGMSRETYKGILDGTSRGVFDGTIIVRPDAQKTDARQVNRNLLLSDGALVDTKPQLEIRADDVKCAHAATIGRLDETSLFYLRARGIGMEEARALLIHAFAGEVLGGIKTAPLRGAIDAAVSRLLLGKLWDAEAA